MKLIFGIIFTAIVLISVKLYFERDTKSLKQTFDEANTSQSAIIVEDFLYHRYKAGKIDTRMEAKLGQFLEPNKAEFFGDFRLDMYKDNERTSLQSEQAVGVFSGKGLANMISGSTLDTIILEDSVRIKFKDSFITTNYAQFIPKTNKISSSYPVKVTNDTHWFTANKGFNIDIKSEIAEFEGNIDGEVFPNGDMNEVE